MTKSRILTCLLLAPLFLLTSCALTRDHISIEYQPLSQPQIIPQAEKVYVKVDVLDHRTDKSKVSCKKNGYGMEMASIISKEDVKQIVNQAISQELSSRGFILEEGGDPNVFIGVELLKFYSDFKVGFFVSESVSELIMNVEAKDSSDEKKYKKVVTALGNERPVFIYGGGNARRSLEDVLQKGIAELMEDREFLNALVRSN